MNKTIKLLLAITSTLCITACGETGSDHDHGDNTMRSGTDHVDETSKADDHDHGQEQELPAATLGDMTIELAQAHGAIQPGKEGHLIVKLPYNDKGETIVRAWIGSEDRTLSMVGKGEYAPSHDDYDVHCIAPNPLPENTMWWIEIEKPDGTKLVGSAQPITE